MSFLEKGKASTLRRATRRSCRNGGGTRGSGRCFFPASVSRCDRPTVGVIAADGRISCGGRSSGNLDRRRQSRGGASALDRIENLTLDWRFLLAGRAPRLKASSSLRSMTRRSVKPEAIRCRERCWRGSCAPWRTAILGRSRSISPSSIPRPRKRTANSPMRSDP